MWHVIENHKITNFHVIVLLMKCLKNCVRLKCTTHIELE